MPHTHAKILVWKFQCKMSRLARWEKNDCFAERDLKILSDAWPKAQNINHCLTKFQVLKATAAAVPVNIVGFKMFQMSNNLFLNPEIKIFPKFFFIKWGVKKKISLSILAISFIFYISIFRALCILAILDSWTPVVYFSSFP